MSALRPMASSYAATLPSTKLQLPAKAFQLTNELLLILIEPEQSPIYDGFIVRGNSAINQAPVTGESIPVDKRAVADIDRARAKPDIVGSESKVFAGTINGASGIEIEVTKKSSDSALARVVKMVSEADR